MVLVIGKTTRNDTDFVPYEVQYAVDSCRIPIIAVYTDYDYVTIPAALSALWPPALAQRIANGTARTIHIAFKQALIDAAIRQFNINNQPAGSLIYYTKQYQQQLGLRFV